MLANKISPINIKMIEVMHTSFCDHNAIQLEISNKKELQNHSMFGNLKMYFLIIPSSIDEFKIKIRIYLNLNDNENSTTQKVQLKMCLEGNLQS